LGVEVWKEDLGGDEDLLGCEVAIGRSQRKADLAGAVFLRLGRCDINGDQMQTARVRRGALGRGEAV